MSLMCKIVKLNGSAGNGVDVASRTDANSIQTHNKVAIWTLQKLDSRKNCSYVLIMQVYNGNLKEKKNFYFYYYYYYFFFFIF